MQDPQLANLKTDFHGHARKTLDGFAFFEGEGAITARRTNIWQMEVTGNDRIAGKPFTLTVELPPLLESFQGATILADALAAHHLPLLKAKEKKQHDAKWNVHVTKKDGAAPAVPLHRQV